MSGTKKLPKYVTHTMLAKFSRAADVAFTVRLAAMEDRLRAEFALPDTRPTCEDIMQLADEIDATYEGNHLAPTTHEGDE